MKRSAHGAGNRGRLGEWVSARDGFIEADVILWTEAVYEKRRGRKAKARRLGERRIAAEVIEATSDGWLKLLVCACAITRDDYAGGAIPSLRIGDTIKRARKTVMRGKPERLAWSDETVREALRRERCLEHSRFLPRSI